MSSDFNDHRFPVKSPTACQLKWSWLKDEFDKHLGPSI